MLSFLLLFHGFHCTLTALSTHRPEGMAKTLPTWHVQGRSDKAGASLFGDAVILDQVVPVRVSSQPPFLHSSYIVDLGYLRASLPTDLWLILQPADGDQSSQISSPLAPDIDLHRVEQLSARPCTCAAAHVRRKVEKDPLLLLHKGSLIILVSY